MKRLSEREQRWKAEAERRKAAGLSLYTDPNRALTLGDIVKYREVVDPSDATSLYVLLDDPAEQSIATQRGESPARVTVQALGTNLAFPPTCTRNLSDFRLATVEEIQASVPELGQQSTDLSERKRRFIENMKTATPSDLEFVRGELQKKAKGGFNRIANEEAKVAQEFIELINAELAGRK
jgi:hypothetical protein